MLLFLRLDDDGQSVQELRQALQARGSNLVVRVGNPEEELLRLADRIVVLHDGCVAGELARDEATEEGVMALATGGGAE